MRELINDAVLLSREEFDGLANYSCSVPTGTTPGKRWRRAAFYAHQEISDRWLLCEYGQPYPEGHEYHGQIPIHSRWIVVAGVSARWPRDVAVRP